MTTESFRAGPGARPASGDNTRNVLAEGTVKRLSVYRQLLSGIGKQGRQNVFSHELAALAGVTAAQVRRDLMLIGYAGCSRRGYQVAGLIERIGTQLDLPNGQSVVVVGLGNLGRAIIAYLTDRRERLSIAAAFDIDPMKVNCQLHGCPCYPMSMLGQIVRGSGVRVAILAVPGEAAQEVASGLVDAGVRGLLNFAPARLHVPESVYVEDLDIAASLEKIAFFSRQPLSEKEVSHMIQVDIDPILNKYRGAGRDALIPILQEVQEQHGYLSREAVVLIGRHLNLPSSKIYGVATFYNQFRFQPKGRYHIQVCRGTACHVKGSLAVLEAVKRELKVKAGQTTRDGLFSLEVVACMGACGLAPVICVNGEFHAKVTPKKLARIIAECREKELTNVQA